ncbi:MAG: SurA N-terminal domain-containing protein [Clostridia bacterium]|nr:SurA N-terminal domain-containing protein [Clostridia bacterium]
MHFLKKTTAVLVCVLMLVSASACSSTDAADKIETVQVNSVLDRDATAATVGDEVITVGEVEDAYNEYVQMYSYYGQPVPTEDADIETVQDTVVEMLVKTQILTVKAKENGCDVLSEEQEAELEKAVADEEANLINYYLEEGGDPSDEKAREAAIDLINADLVNYGWNMGFEEYMEYLRNYYRETYASQNLENLVKQGAEVTAEEVQSYYDSLLEDQTVTMEDATQYLSGEMDYEMGAGDIVVVVPENYARIKVLTVQPEGAMDESYESIRSEMLNLEAEYGKLVLSGSEDQDRIAEIEKDYADRKASADVMQEEYIGAAREKIRDAYDKLQSGASFDEVFAEYNEDTVYTAYPEIGEKGYLILLTDEDGYWSETIRNAASGLKAGEYSEILSEDDVFHIVYMVGAEKPGQKQLEDIREAVTKLALAEKQEEVWKTTQDEWTADRSIVKLYPDAYRPVGK